MQIHQPDRAEEVQTIVQRAIEDEAPLEILGAGSKRAWGRPLEVEQELGLDKRAGIQLYEPGELVLSALAGTPIAEIQVALDDNHQEFAFEPQDLRPLLGEPAGAGTIGGVVAANLSGPKRIKAGAARDHVLGFTAVSGRGDLIKSGGRVVKNVTSYDLSKLITGSFGTLAVMTEVTLKVLPAPETEQTLLTAGQARVTLLARLRAALASA